MKPSVSIVIPNYTYGHFIKQTMESAIGRTYTDIIFIE